MSREKKWVVLALLALAPLSLIGQNQTLLPADSFHSKRFWGLASLGSGIYGAAVIGLNAAWYKDNPRTSFHFFNDWGEWNHMDKVGHAYTSYFEADLCAQGAAWTGMSNKAATWTGIGAAFIMQSTVEVFDAYSAEWGFSWADMAANALGLGLFGFQQLHWRDQRMRLKVSSSLQGYDPSLVTAISGTAMQPLSERAEELFGSGPFERYLKDYNAQTVWLSINLHSMLPVHVLPPWLNLAVGYGSKNLYGGFSNSWQVGGEQYRLSAVDYPRTRQWYLSPDIDFSRIRTKSPVLRTMFAVANLFKVPAPALEVSGGKVKWLWLHL